MAYWNGKEIIYHPAKQSEFYPGWEELDCGCCNGLRWGGEQPKDCPDCGGTGRLFRHIKSRVLADYPGGPLRGRDVAAANCTWRRSRVEPNSADQEVGFD